MKDLLLDVIASYEGRVAAVETLVTNVYDTAADSGAGLSDAYETEQKLKDSLRETLVRNCSLRRKDFDAFAARIFSDIEATKVSIERDRKSLRETLKAYLEHQKQLVASLKEQLVGFTDDGSHKDGVEAALEAIKTNQKEEGEQAFSLFTEFQVRLKSFCQELEGLNHELQRVVERGESLRLEDLRQLRALFAVQRRREESRLRSQDVRRLLAGFNRERHATTHNERTISRRPQPII